MFKRLKRLFKRKRHAPIYPVGGYPNTLDLYGRARSGEMVVNKSKLFDIAKRCGATADDQRFKDALLEVLDDIEDSGITVNEDELASRICECAEAFDVSSKVAKTVCENLKRIQRKSVKVTNCPNCGAVMHGNICDYCGTEL